jgi:hypothetical protein
MLNHRYIQPSEESTLTELTSVKTHVIQFAPIVNGIQMKWRKGFDTMKNSVNKKSEHYLESQSIEVMNREMQIHQFVLIANLIGMKWLKLM